MSVVAQVVFKVYGGLEAKRLVESRPVVEAFGVAENFAFGLRTSGQGTIANGFAFERSSEALRARVVIAVACPAHAGHRAVAGQQLTVGVASVLAGKVGVVH